MTLPQTPRAQYASLQARYEAPGQPADNTSTSHTPNPKTATAPNPMPDTIHSEIFDRALRHLLTALNWMGQDRQIIEAKPHLHGMTSLDDLRATLGRLGYTTTPTRLPERKITSHTLPCLADLHGQLRLLLSLDGEVLRYYDPQTDQQAEMRLSRRRVTLYLTAETADAAGSAAPNSTQAPNVTRSNWFLSTLSRFRKPLIAISLLSLLANILSLATPLYVMAVYDRAVGGKALETLFSFLAIAVVVIGFEMVLRLRRARLVAYVGARMHNAISNAALSRLLRLPVQMTESAGLSTQLMRFRQFEAVRGFFTGHILAAILDLPFTLFFIGLVVWWGGALALVPLSLILVFGALSILVLPTARRNTDDSGLARSQSAKFLAETLEQADTLRHLQIHDIWLNRFADIARADAQSRFKARFFDTVLHILSQSMVIIAGVATLAVGALSVINGTLSIGALIAIMIVVWRIMMPIQTMFISLGRIAQLRQTIRQINTLMAIPVERSTAQVNRLRAPLQGRVTARDLVFRHGPQTDPVIRNVSLRLEHGEIIGLSGPSGAGKTTLTKLLMGLYMPQAGSIHFDGLNLRQLDAADVRNNIGYAPQRPHLFYGTVRQNLALAAPTASDAMMLQALQIAGVSLSNSPLSEGLDTPVRAAGSAWPEGFCMQLTLARAFVKPCNLLILDDPGAYLDPQGDSALLAALSGFKGRMSVLLVSNRPSHLRQCDRIIQLRQGAVIGQGTPEAVLKQSA